jgi:hypothetical protein
MSSTEETPENLNYLSQLGFRFAIKRLPMVNYFCQAASIPGVSINSMDTPTPFTVIPHPGSRMTFEPLNIRFRVDENLKNYLEIYNWIVGISRPDNFQQTVEFLNKSGSYAVKPGSRPTYTSDGTLFVLNSNKRVKFNVFFEELFPVSLSELQFESTSSDVQYLESQVQFRYRKFSIEPI